MGKESLGAYVAARRKSLNLTQNDLAQALGYTNQAISKFESEGSLLSILVFPDLANILQCSLSDLLTRNPNPVLPKEAAKPFEPETFRKNLISLRQKAGYSQSQEARLLGVSARSVQNYESGSSYPSFASLEKLVDVTGVGIEDLFYGGATPVAAPVTPEPKPAPSNVIPRKKPFFFSRLVVMGTLLVGVAIAGCTAPLWGADLVAQNKYAGDSSAGSSSSSGTSSSYGDSSSSIGGSSSNDGGSSSTSSSSSNGSSSSSSGDSSSSGSSSNDSSSQGSSSSQGGSSSSSGSSSQGGGSSSSSSSSSSTPSDWLSPYLPGLKSFVLNDQFGNQDSSTLYTQESTFYLTTNGLDFLPTNANKYAVEYFFENAPAGVTIKVYDTSALYYTYRKIVVDPSVPKETSFTLRAKAYAVSHPEAPIYSNPISLITNDYSLADYDSDGYPGLKHVEVLIDGVSSLQPIGVGTHSVTLSTYPANYLKDHPNVTVKITCPNMNTNNATFDGKTLTLVEDGFLYEEIYGSFFVNFAYTNSNGIYCSFTVTRPLCYDGSASSQKDFFVLDGKCVGGDYAAGTYTLKCQSFAGVSPDFSDTDYQFKVTLSGSVIPEGLSVSYGGYHDPILLTVPAGLSKFGNFTLNGYLISRTDATQIITSANFWIYGV
jgi:transcriptional regulator with XRE-family HTH domain